MPPPETSSTRRLELENKQLPKPNISKTIGESFCLFQWKSWALRHYFIYSISEDNSARSNTTLFCWDADAFHSIVLLCGRAVKPSWISHELLLFPLSSDLTVGQCLLRVTITWSRKLTATKRVFFLFSKTGQIFSSLQVLRVYFGENTLYRDFINDAWESFLSKELEGKLQLWNRVICWLYYHAGLCGLTRKGSNFAWKKRFFCNNTFCNRNQSRLMVGNLCGKAPLTFLATFLCPFHLCRLEVGLVLGRGLLRGAGMSVLRELRRLRRGSVPHHDTDNWKVNV